MKRINYIVFERSVRGGEYIRESVAFTHTGSSHDNRLDDEISNRIWANYRGHEDRIRVERHEMERAEV